MQRNPENKSGQFPATHWSAIVAARSDNKSERTRGFDSIIQSYWRPVYKSIRIKWQKSDADAQDLTQSFFLNVIEKEYFSAYEPAKGRFRTYLRTCLDRFLMNEDKAAGRVKRGGKKAVFSLDYESAEKELAGYVRSDDVTFENYFDQEWVRGIFSTAVEELERSFSCQNKNIYFKIFEKYDLNDSDQKITYDTLAKSFDLPVTKVTNYLARARKKFRDILMEKLRAVTASDREFNDELKTLLNIRFYGIFDESPF